MTEYEYADLFASFLAAQNTVFANFMTLVFAMVTASWFLAHKLSRKLAAVLLFIYSISAINMSMGVWAAFSDFSSLGLKIHEVSQLPDSSLGWIGPAGDGIGYLRWMPTQMAILCALSYLGSVVFFFIARKRKDA